VNTLTRRVYRYWREHAELEKIKEGTNSLAAALSLGQDLAVGNACAAFLMVGDLENAARSHGDHECRYVHFESTERILLPRRSGCEQRASKRFSMSV
jgi:hypothetical protein